MEELFIPTVGKEVASTGKATTQIFSMAKKNKNAGGTAKDKEDPQKKKVGGDEKKKKNEEESEEERYERIAKRGIMGLFSSEGIAEYKDQYVVEQDPNALRRKIRGIGTYGYIKGKEGLNTIGRNTYGRAVKAFNVTKKIYNKSNNKITLNIVGIEQIDKRDEIPKTVYEKNDYYASLKTVTDDKDTYKNLIDKAKKTQEELKMLFFICNNAAHEKFENINHENFKKTSFINLFIFQEKENILKELKKQIEEYIGNLKEITKIYHKKTKHTEYTLINQFIFNNQKYMTYNNMKKILSETTSFLYNATLIGPLLAGVGDFNTEHENFITNKIFNIILPKCKFKPESDTTPFSLLAENSFCLVECNDFNIDKFIINRLCILYKKNGSTCYLMGLGVQNYNTTWVSSDIEVENTNEFIGLMDIAYDYPICYINNPNINVQKLMFDTTDFDKIKKIYKYEYDKYKKEVIKNVTISDHQASEKDNIMDKNIMQQLKSIISVYTTEYTLSENDKSSEKQEEHIKNSGYYSFQYNCDNSLKNNDINLKLFKNYICIHQNSMILLNKKIKKHILNSKYWEPCFINPKVCNDDNEGCNKTNDIINSTLATIMCPFPKDKKYEDEYMKSKFGEDYNEKKSWEEKSWEERNEEIIEGISKYIPKTIKNFYNSSLGVMDRIKGRYNKKNQGGYTKKYKKSHTKKCKKYKKQKKIKKNTPI